MNPNYLPATDAQLLLWLNNFREKVQMYSGSLGLDANDLLAIEADYKAYAYMLAQIEALKGEVQTRVDFKDVLRDGPDTGASLPFPGNIVFAEHPSVTPRPGILPRVLMIIRHVQSQPGYTAQIGRELGLEPVGLDEVPIAPTGIIPTAEDGLVRLEYVVGPHDGVLIEGKRADELAWTPLAITFTHPFIDSRPNLVPGVAESRSYRLRYVDGTECCGEYSEEITVVAPAYQATGATLR
ncbi:MAG TPA: hypothetical protein VEX38_03655 [Fimbriimonadaceae bacterium]|nr:hypothetical protein [Fimbriimonadaceae bacterium]